MAEEKNTQVAESAVTVGQAVTPKQETSRTAPPLPEGVKYIWGTGRRKKAIARVRICPGTGKFTVNERDYDKFFTEDKDRRSVLAPLTSINMVKAWDIFANVNGGGFAGQAGAVTLGLARAVIRAMPEIESALRGQGLLTRDARMKERKKYGQKGARKRFQFSKR
jgi:small subunit ribosomal protein S9